MFNRSLYPLVDNDEFLVWQMTQEFHHHWPQFNEHTKIQLTQESVILFHEISDRIEPPNLILKPIPVWRQFKYWLFNRPVPDDYEGRWQWQKVLWVKAFKVLQYKLMRFVGKLLNRPRIFAATMEWTPDPKAAIPFGNQVEIQLRHFGWQVEGEYSLRSPYENMRYIDAGYYPARDILFVRLRKG